MPGDEIKDEQKHILLILIVKMMGLLSQMLDAIFKRGDK